MEGTILYLSLSILLYGGFLKWGPPKSSIWVGFFNFSMKYTIQLLEYHHLWNPPYIYIYITVPNIHMLNRTGGSQGAKHVPNSAISVGLQWITGKHSQVAMENHQRNIGVKYDDISSCWFLWAALTDSCYISYWYLIQPNLPSFSSPFPRLPQGEAHLGLIGIERTSIFHGLQELTFTWQNLEPSSGLVSNG